MNSKKYVEAALEMHKQLSHENVQEMNKVIESWT